MTGRYPDAPGFVPGSSTSAAAAEAAVEFAASMADWCEAWFRYWTEHGRLKTCEECEIASRAGGGFGRHQSISARIRTDLFLTRKCLYKVATDLTTSAAVPIWATSNTSKLVVNTRGQVVYLTRRNTTGRSAVLYGWGYPENDED